MRPITKFALALRELGPAWLARRVWTALLVRFGLMRLMSRSRPWCEWPTSSFRAVKIAGSAAPREGYFDGLRSGRLHLFGGAATACGNPPDWHRNLLSGKIYPPSAHWSRIPDFSQGDIKGVWEASRWSWAYDCVAMWRSRGDDAAPLLFWEWAESWMTHNSPCLGVNWKCGQEASIRLFAAAYALSAFDGHPSTTPARRSAMSRLAAATAERIESHLGYAVAQDNNHGISEAAGLVTAAVLWPELPHAARRKALGLRTLERLCDRLIAPDGTFSQHSTNYQRVMLDVLCWTQVALASVGESLPSTVLDAARRSADCLFQLQVGNGRVARHGADDGALVLPLSGCAYEDFRPTLAACALLFGSASPGPGPWQAQALAMSGAADSPRPAALMPRWDAAAGGVHVRRVGDVAVFFRAPIGFRFRPSHADQLHVSLYVAGAPVADDVGTVSYNDASRPWADFASARFHNVPTVDGRDPMTRAGRFLWLPWTPCELEVSQPTRLVASHRGFDGFVVRREICILPDMIRITDTFVGDREADLAVRWHGRSRQGLEALRISSEVGLGADTWHSADTSSGLGFYAERYAAAVPSHCRVFTLRARRATIVTQMPIPVS